MSETTRSADILDQIQLNAAQAKAVRCEGDVVVTAGAGTGKTRTLVARYLSLLQQGIRPVKIVAITFTRKAAREMRNRIRHRIRDWLHVEAANQEHWRAVYADLDLAYIGTIHGLCADILRSHPTEAVVDPAFEMLEENIASVLKNRAVENTLRWAADQRELYELFQTLGPNGTRVYLSQLIQQPCEAKRCFAANGSDPLPIWRDALRRHVARFWEAPSLQRDLDALYTLKVAGHIDRAEARDDKLAPYLRSFLTYQAQLETAWQNQDWDRLFNLLPAWRRSMSSVGRKANWPDDPDPKAILKALRERYDQQVKPWLKRDMSWTVDKRAAEMLPALRQLFDHCLSEYDQAKAQQGALDYDDLEEKALVLLSSHPAVAKQWQARTEAILVDEFQDTNEQQRQLVDLLGAGSGHRFLVGDAKQSIYRFRGADVTVFRDVQARIERIGAHIALTRTYRAHESLTEGLNALLAPLMEKREGDEAYMVPFAPLEAARQRPETKIEGPYVELLVGLGKDADQGRDVAARALASRLWALHTKAGVDFGEMALLFRASTGFPQWEDALEKAEIPFITVAGRGFFDRPEVRDILGALKALANPADDLAMTGLLRSPAIGISDASIYRLRWDKENTEGPRGLWRSLHNCTDCLSEPDRSRAERALEILTPLQRIIGRLPVVTVMKRFLDETGYQAIARRSGDERARRNIEKLLTNAHRSQQVSVSAFLEYVRTMRDVSAREGEAPVEAEGAVQLMTIHQAKGLEFPVVVLADLGRSPYRGRNGLLLSRTWGPLIPLQIDQMSSIVYALGKQREQDKEEAEAKRLLYVAATRAADKLILNGHGTASTRKNGTLSIQFRGWLGTIGETLGADKKPWKSPDIMQQDSMPIRLAQNPDWIEGTLYTPAFAPSPPPLTEREKPEKLPALSKTPMWRAIASTPESDNSQELEKNVQEPETRRVWHVTPDPARPRAPHWVIGELAAEALHNWCFPDDVRFSALIGRLARRKGLIDKTSIARTTTKVEKRLRHFMATSLYRQIKAATQRYQGLTCDLTGTYGPEHYVLDILYRDSQETWHLVWLERKQISSTNELKQQISARWPQTQRQITAVEALLGQRPRATLCFLNYRQGVKVISP